MFFLELHYKSNVKATVSTLNYCQACQSKKLVLGRIIKTYICALLRWVVQENIWFSARLGLKGVTKGGGRVWYSCIHSNLLSTEFQRYESDWLSAS